MAITTQSHPRVKAKDGKSNAQPRRLRINLDVDLTGSGELTQQRLTRVLNEVADATEMSLAEAGLSEAKVTGRWEWVYGPWSWGEIS